MPSIREVAKDAGVSISTVSRVLNGHSTVAPQLRNQVMAAVSRCSYLPAVGRRTSNTIALVYAGVFTPGSPYDAACLDGMVESMRASSFDLTIVDLRRDKLEDESFRQFFGRKGIGGAIVRCTSAERDLVSRMADEGLPLVVLGDHFDHPTLPFVYASSRDASSEAVEHLISLGHVRIALAVCERDDGDHADRYAAFRETLSAVSLLDEELICRIPPHRLDGSQLLRNWMGMPHPPTAVFIADPLIAVGVINEAQNMRIKIPDDLSIIGFDDTDTRSSVYPRMTAVCQDSRLLGREAFQRIRQLVEDDLSGAQPLRPQSAWLEINSTTAPAPAVAYRVLAGGVRLPTAPRAKVPATLPAVAGAAGK